MQRSTGPGDAPLTVTRGAGEPGSSSRRMTSVAVQGGWCRCRSTKSEAPSPADDSARHSSAMQSIANSADGTCAPRRALSAAAHLRGAAAQRRAQCRHACGDARFSSSAAAAHAQWPHSPPPQSHAQAPAAIATGNASAVSARCHTRAQLPREADGAPADSAAPPREGRTARGEGREREERRKRKKLGTLRASAVRSPQPRAPRP